MTAFVRLSAGQIRSRIAFYLKSLKDGMLQHDPRSLNAVELQSIELKESNSFLKTKNLREKLHSENLFNHTDRIPNCYLLDQEIFLKDY